MKITVTPMGGEDRMPVVAISPDLPSFHNSGFFVSATSLFLIEREVAEKLVADLQKAIDEAWPADKEGGSDEA